MWVLPTRSRVDNCKRFVEAWKNTLANTPVYVRLDDCDPFLQELKSIKWPKEFTINVGPRQGLRSAMQEMFERFPNESWYGLLADDLIPRTPNWDVELIEIAGSKKISYPNDLTTSQKGLPTHPVVGGELIRELGWFGFPVTHHYYVDTVWRYLGNELGNLIYAKETIVEHMHPVRQKAERDTIYDQSKSHMETDTQYYNKWIEEVGPGLVERLKAKGF